MKGPIALVAASAVAGSSAFMNGVTGTYNPQHVKEGGGNSIKTYDEPQLQAVACSADLDVYATIPVDPHDSVDQAAWKAVDFYNRYKSKDCIKIWGIGNELDLKGDPAQMMQLAASVSRAVKGAGASKTSSCLGGKDRLPQYLQYARQDVDVLCVNCYGCADDLCSVIAASGYQGDYILGEYGVNGWWEQPKVPDTNVPLEPSSTEKAVQMARAYDGGVTKCAGTGVNPLGAFAFTNERKIEASATWFGLWAQSPGVANNEPQPVADRWAVLKEIWAGRPPAPDAVKDVLKAQGIAAVDKMIVSNDGQVGPNGYLSASVALTDPGLSGAYTVQWEMRPDITPGAVGGTSGATMQSNEPRVVSQTASDGSGGLRGGSFETSMTAPGIPGAYRLTAFLVPKDASGGKGVVTVGQPIIVR